MTATARDRRILPIICGGLLLAAGAASAQNDTLGKTMDARQQAQRASVASQQRIDQLDDQTHALLERYRSATWQAQQFNVYAQQLNELLAEQTAELQSLHQQLGDLDRAGQDLMPLMLRMTDSLEKFVALDLPFLHDERQERIGNLKRALGDPQVNAGEKFRRILEVYQIEIEYGRTFGVERVASGEETLDVLRVGRIALYALTPDGGKPRIWDATGGKWEALSGGDAAAIREGLKMARELTAVNLLELPVPAARRAP